MYKASNFFFKIGNAKFKLMSDLDYSEIRMALTFCANALQKEGDYKVIIIIESFEKIFIAKIIYTFSK